MEGLLWRPERVCGRDDGPAEGPFEEGYGDEGNEEGTRGGVGEGDDKWGEGHCGGPPGGHSAATAGEREVGRPDEGSREARAETLADERSGVPADGDIDEDNEGPAAVLAEDGGDDGGADEEVGKVVKEEPKGPVEGLV